jgi:tRNA/tmRNA/rRNA uracil-C5-methylase (TrmA/RlmC/RlmD family)
VSRNRDRAFGRAGEAAPPRRVRIDRLAPTGEGVAREDGVVGFVERALPGELVETNVYQVKKSFWRGTVRAVLEPSADRVSGGHADCAGCDWSHFEAAASRRAKRELFLETLRRIGGIDPASVPPIEVAASGAGYRLRSRLHVSGRGADAALGYFSPHSHRVASAASCEALSRETRDLLPALRKAISTSGADVSDVAILEAPDPGRRLLLASARVGGREEADRLADALAPLASGAGVRGEAGRTLARRGLRRLAIEVGGRTLRASAGAFFQANRHLLEPLHAAVSAEAAGAPPGDALDAFGGAGLLAGALLAGGRRVVSVESDAEAAACAREARREWPDGRSWTIEEEDVAGFLERDDARFACVVADPPRAGLGKGVAAELADRCAGRFVYVSCDPATLARDLAAILGRGFVLRSCALFDLFAFTHRVEAVVSLDRAA